MSRKTLSRKTPLPGSRRRHRRSFVCCWLGLPSRISGSPNSNGASRNWKSSRLGKTPQNSSLPPSSQHPHAKPCAATVRPRRIREETRWPTGSSQIRAGLDFHRGMQRGGDAQAASACRRCGDRLAGNDSETLCGIRSGSCRRSRPLVTEYQLHRLLCPTCGITTCADLPAGVPTGQAGPQLIALVALLMGCFRQSKRSGSLVFWNKCWGNPVRQDGS